MPKKLFNPLEDPPTASSSEDNEVETDSDSETDPYPIHEIGKAIAEKEGSHSPAVKSGKKRPNEGTSRDMHVKRARTLSGNDEKKPYFQRLWSEEDEISLLQGMIDFKAETGTSPFDDVNGFYDIVKKYISFSVSKIQVSDKIRGLKRKYFGNQKKKVFESSHDKKCLGLAEYIWGSNGMALESPVKPRGKSKKKVEEEEDKRVLEYDGMALESLVKSNGKSEKVESLKHNTEKVEDDKQVLIRGGDSVTTNWFEKSFLVGSIVSLGVDEYSVMQKWSKVPVETKKRIEEKFKLVKAKEIELLLQKTDILKEVTYVLSEAI